MQRKPNRPLLVVLIPLLVILLIAGIIGFFVYRAINGDSYSFAVRPLIALEGCSNVRVTGSNSGNTVHVKLEHGRDYERAVEGDTLYLKGLGCFDVSLQVPAHADLLIKASSLIEVSGVSGQIQLEGGQIILHKSTFESKSSLKSSSEVIYFRGTIADQAELSIIGSSNILDIELPEDAAFYLDITGSPKTFNSSFSELQQVMNGPEASDFRQQGEVHLQVGGDPRARLIINASGTSILLTGV
jgi:hypothetical protein